jgi:hypothetical protein
LMTALRTLVATVGLSVAVVGCAAEPEPSVPDPITRIPLPVVQWSIYGMPAACAGVGFHNGRMLHGSPSGPFTTWIEAQPGKPEQVVWPVGYSAIFTPQLQVLDAVGRVVAVEGSVATGGCPMPPGGWLIEF